MAIIAPIRIQMRIMRGIVMRMPSAALIPIRIRRSIMRSTRTSTGRQQPPMHRISLCQAHQGIL